MAPAGTYITRQEVGERYGSSPIALRGETESACRADRHERERERKKEREKERERERADRHEREKERERERADRHERERERERERCLIKIPITITFVSPCCPPPLLCTQAAATIMVDR
jgi:hypothetical protein